MATEKKRPRGRPRTAPPNQVAMGFRVEGTKKAAIEKLLVERKHDGKPIHTKQDLFAYIVDELLAGRVKIRTRRRKAA